MLRSIIYVHVYIIFDFRVLSLLGRYFYNMYKE